MMSQIGKNIINMGQQTLFHLIPIRNDFQVSINITQLQSLWPYNSNLSERWIDTIVINTLGSNQPLWGDLRPIA